ncbi:MAG: hypothetical protein HKM93_17095 [Desulfobacteraceae bacterium]|nr:hypothetical protein [Desulfobacteraceae bacterium]
MFKKYYDRMDTAFENDHAIYWSHLSRLNTLLVVVNISMFFLTGLVAKGYYYTFFSLICLGIVGVGILVPTTLIRRLWYYWIFFLVEMVSLYYLVNSIVYWIRNGAQ